MMNKFEAEIIARTTLVREGVELQFLERKSGNYVVLASRRTKPLLKAKFMANKDEAVAWRDSGLLPQGETSELFGQFQSGTWPAH